MDFSRNPVEAALYVLLLLCDQMINNAVKWINV